MKTKKMLILASVFLSIGIFGCKKERGCTDSSATNFSSSAEEDDGSCTFKGEVVLWYNQSTSSFLTGDGATSLTYRVDGQIVGSTAANVYWVSAPSCGSNGSITVTKDMGGSKSKSYSYSVKDQTGWEYWAGNVTFEANTCKALQLN